jgi:maleate isomerase
MVPSSNTAMEPDFARGLPDGWTLHSARMFLEETTPEAESRMLDEFALPAARDLATARPDVVVFGCTSAGALRGNDYDTELCARISEMTGVPTVSTIQSVRAAIAGAQAKRVGIATPYVEALNEKIAASVAADGVEVVRIEGLGITENFQIARVEPTQIAAFVVEILGGLEIDLAVVSCTNFRAVEALATIRERLGLPTISSNQAVLDATIDTVRSPTRA